MAKQVTICAMCGKNIMHSTQVLKRQISDKFVEFDSLDCANIYERLQTIYGNSIQI